MVPETPLPGSSLGMLSFEAPEGCSIDYYLYDVNGTELGKGTTGVALPMGAGTYDISLVEGCVKGTWDNTYEPCEFLRIEEVKVQVGQETVVDLTQNVGGAFVSRRPFGLYLLAVYYRPKSAWEGYQFWGPDTQPFCFLPSPVTIVSDEVNGPGEALSVDTQIEVGKVTDLNEVFWGQIGWLRLVPDGDIAPASLTHPFVHLLDDKANNLDGYGTSGGDSIAVKVGTYDVAVEIGDYYSTEEPVYRQVKVNHVEVKAGETTTVSLPLGRITIHPNDVDIEFLLYDQATNNYLGRARLGDQQPYFWVVPGNYKVVMSNPYPGVTFENVEVKSGETKALELP